MGITLSALARHPRYHPNPEAAIRTTDRLTEMPSLHDLSLAELESHVESLGAPKYRARQVWEWAYRHVAASYDEMPNVPADLRRQLDETLPFPVLTVVTELASDDGLTRKRLIRLHDGKLIESVLMLYDPRSDSRGRATVCVSSQAGCAMGCIFCATGQAGFDRNLTAGEILAQIIGFAREQADLAAQPLTNVVFMGMGEPMANYRAVWRTVETLHDPNGMNMAARHITISTVGLIPGIRKLADESLQVGLPSRCTRRTKRCEAAIPGSSLSVAGHPGRVRLHREDGPASNVRCCLWTGSTMRPSRRAH
jgi:23S rRNA (adenine2503-C2)-methyltransferase